MKSPARLSGNKKRELAQLVMQATRALGTQHMQAFHRLCEKIEGIQSGNADVANLRALICVQSGDWDGARALLEHAATTEPRRPEFHHNLAKLYVAQGRYAEAEEHYRDALQCNPNSLEIILGYCACLLDTGKADEALPLLEKMQKKQPYHRALMMGLAGACTLLNRIEESMDYLQQVIATEADYADAHFEYAILLMRCGRMDEAEAEFRSLLSLQPDHAKAYGNLVMMRRVSVDDIRAMEELKEKAGPDSEDRIHLCFALAKAYEDMEQFDTAFGFYEQGNAVVSRQSSYDLEAGLAQLEARATCFTSDQLRRTSGLEDERPIFIVGMPRCGSTLIERILAAHPEVISRGECSAMDEVFSESRDSDKPLILDDAASFSSDQWREIGAAYLGKVDQGSPSKRIIDKTLSNYAMLGAIHCALPRARIVHVRRNPLDNCLAIYRTHFENRQLDLSSDLSHIGRLYRTYQRIMQHWREVLPEGVMYELDYEQLVADQENETRQLLAACGLEWNEACLRFNKVDAYVETASLAQVRRPMYTEAVDRWRRYEKHLKPLIRILGTDSTGSDTPSS